MVAALASYLDARASGGRWLLRMDDLDRARCRPGSAERITRQLTELGLQWDEEIRWQSRHETEYATAFERLRSAGLLFQCDCTRQQIRASMPTRVGDDVEPICVGNCRRRRIDGDAAWRVDLSDWIQPTFEDRWQGRIAIDPTAHHDRVVLRRDGVYGYHLTVVVDDMASGVTDVVRGADLLGSVPVQSAIYRALGAACPRYAHCPVVVASDGSKLAKSQHSLAIDAGDPAGVALGQALRLLRQAIPVDLDQIQPAELLGRAWRAWSPDRFQGLRTQPISGR